MRAKLQQGLLLFAVLVGFWMAFEQPAVADSPRVTQLAHTAWRSREGDIPDAAASLAQTADGQLWIGTQSGLLRFDGIRFVPWHPAATEDLDPRIFSLHAGSDGTLWIGTGSGLFHLVDGNVKRLSTGRINQIVGDGGSGVWITRTRQTEAGGGLCHVTPGKMVCTDKLPRGGASVAVDAHGEAWFVSSSGSLLRWSGEVATPYIDTKYGAASALQATFVAAAPGGAIVVGMKPQHGRPYLRRLERDVWENIPLPQEADSSTSIEDIFLETDASIWIGTSNHGLFHISAGKAEHFGENDGLSGDEITDIFQDAEGTLWVASSGGLDSFHRPRVETWSKREGLTADSVSSVFAGPDGRVWMGNLGGLDLLEHGVIHALRSGEGLPGTFVGPMLVDSQNRLWMGLDHGLWIDDHGRLSEVRDADGKSLEQFFSLAEDADHTIWARGNGVLHIRETSVVERFTEASLVGALYVAAAPEGGVWVSTLGGGLVRIQSGQVTTLQQPSSSATHATSLFVSSGYVWTTNATGVTAWKDGRLHTLTRTNGLDYGRILALVLDAHGNAWLMTANGYARIDHAELTHWLADPTTKVHPVYLDRSDGAQPGFASFQQNAVLAPNGDIWFATDHVAQRIVPDAVLANFRPPPVLIESVQVDGKVYPPSGPLLLPPRSRDITIRYTALSYVNPQHVRFRLRLDGWDSEWHDVDTQREASYTNLPPGHYTFHVQAQSSAGAWNEHGASTGFDVKPSFFQRRSTQIVLAILFCLALWLLYCVRLHLMRKRLRERAEARLAERVRIASDLHDTLLQSAQGLVLRFESLSLQLPENDPLRKTMQEALTGSERLILEGRERIRELHACLETFDEFSVAIQRAVTDLGSQYRPVPFELSLLGKPYWVPGDVCDQIFLITRELLTNAFKHAQPTQIHLTIDFRKDALLLTLTDDGVGMPTWVTTGPDPEHHFGLKGVRERAASILADLKIDRPETGGTRIRLSIPVRWKVTLRRSNQWQHLRAWLLSKEVN